MERTGSAVMVNVELWVAGRFTFLSWRQITETAVRAAFLIQHIFFNISVDTTRYDTNELKITVMNNTNNLTKQINYLLFP